MSGGWDPSKGNLDVVQTEKGLVTLDNTRPAVARELGIDEVTGKVHSLTDPLLPGFAEQREFAKQAAELGLDAPRTWGDVLRIRTMRNNLPVEGTPAVPRLPPRRR